MLTGKNVRADKAKSLKLVDVVADPTALETAAVLVAQQLASGKLVRAPRKRSLVDRIMEDWGYARNYVFQQARATVRSSAPTRPPTHTCAHAHLHTNTPHARIASVRAPGMIGASSLLTCLVIR
jgi:enoyl-CoA hydratase/carnithine racemase